MSMNEVFASQQIGFPILSMLIALPIAIVLLLFVIREQRVARLLAVGGAVAEMALSCVLAVKFVSGSEDMQFVERINILPFLHIQYHVGVDGISVLFIPLTALLGLLALLYSEPQVVKKDEQQYMMALLGFEAMMMGAFASLDLMLFWGFFVAELLPSYLLISRWGTGEKCKEAAKYYVSFMLVGSVFMLAGILLLGLNVSRAGVGDQASHMFDFLTLLSVPIPAQLQTVIFFLLFLGLAIKAPIFPFHTWMPRVLEQGPVVGVSVFLVGLKLGMYGFLRFVIPLLPEASKEWFWLMALLGGVGIVYGSLIALVQTNLRRLLAFASLSHMGVVMVSLFSLNFTGLQGGLLQMINLGLAGSGLFFIAGFLYTRLGPPELSSMGGLESYIPTMAMTFLVISLATIGLPGTGGFNGEHLVMLGAFETHWSMAAVAGLGTFLTAAYLFSYFQKAFLGEPNARFAPSATVKPMPDIRQKEILIATVLGAMIFWIGFDTGPFLHTMNRSIQSLDERVQGKSMAHERYLSVTVDQEGREHFNRSDDGLREHLPVEEH